MKEQAVQKTIGFVQLTGCRCRCGHEWLPHGNNQPGGFERPRVCPKCKTPNWDRPKKFERAGGGGMAGVEDDESKLNSDAHVLSVITPSNKELIELAKRLPPPSDWFQEEEEPPFTT